MPAPQIGKLYKYVFNNGHQRFANNKWISVRKGEIVMLVAWRKPSRDRQSAIQTLILPDGKVIEVKTPKNWIKKSFKKVSQKKQGDKKQ
jgi:hypothetical protein